MYEIVNKNKPSEIFHSVLSILIAFKTKPVFPVVQPGEQVKESSLSNFLLK